MDLLDRAEPVREGASLDVEELSSYLKSKGLKGPFEVQQFTRGYSNVTYLVRSADQELVLRRPPPGVKIETAHDMGREFGILSKLHPSWPKVPKPILLETDPSVLGSPFYLMERVRGVILRARLPKGLELTPRLIRGISENSIDTLAEIHGLDVGGVGLGELGKPAGYVERQVRGWTQRYERAKTEELVDAEFVARWLSEERPPESGACLVHNDFKYDNLVLDPQDLTRVVAVLDWEMATLGDPLLDLGCALAYWTQADDPRELVERSFGPTHFAGNLTRSDVVERYGAKTGRDVSRVAYHYVFGVFKLAVVGQQLYQRFVRGLTTEARYAGLGEAVRAFMRIGRHVIGTGRIDRLE
ncbi:MAG: phosphotransferase family protein [Deltaproteobacteria bacterium]|nr:phosphotransferase family protein [Deltaproteobacteria bacterium]